MNGLQPITIDAINVLCHQYQCDFTEFFDIIDMIDSQYLSVQREISDARSKHSNS